MSEREREREELEAWEGAAAIVLALASVPWSAWVLTVLWGWFVVPVFGLPPVTLWQAAGLSVLVGHFTASQQSKHPLWRQVGTAWAAPAATLTLGWLVHFWV